MTSRGVLKRATVGLVAAAMMIATAALEAQSGAVVLKPADMQKLLPASVFYRGQTATTQLRNSGGAKFPDGYLVFATLVDTSGYSTAVTALYQGQLITEIPINVDGKRLGAGIYGIGFIGDNKFVVTDIGGHEVLRVSSATDAGLQRPRPLEVLSDPSGGFRLYAGRRYVVLTR